MSEWQDQIRNHQVWGHLEALGPALDDAATKAGVDASALDLIDRIRTVNAITGKRLASLDPALVYMPEWEQVSAALQNALAEVQAFVSDGMVGHLNNANSHSSTVLAHLALLLTVQQPGELTALSEAAASYRNAMQRTTEVAAKAVSTVQADASTLAQRLSEFGSDLAAEKTKVSALVNDLQGQFSTAQDNRSKEFSEAQGSRLKEYGDAQTSRQTRFDELTTSYSQRLNDQDAESSKQREALRKQMTDDMAALNEDYNASAREILEQIRRHKTEVEKLVGVIGNLGVTAGHEKAADTAKRATWFWQGMTVLAFGLVIFFAFEAFLPAIQGEFRWEAFAGRVVLTLAVGVFAAYASAQGDRYMEAERRNRKLALELAALGPYLAPLPEDQQQAFRVAFGERTFGREEMGLNRRDRSPATPLDVVVKNKGLRDFVVELVKAVRSN